MHRDFSETAALLGDRRRAAMLMALMDGGTLPAGRLAMVGNVSPQTASSHLAKLVGGEILKVQECGRQRWYRLANTAVAYAVEALLAISSRSTHDRAALVLRLSDQRLAYARSCYTHLAGRLAVYIAHALLEQGVLRHHAARQFQVTQHGRDWFGQLGITLTHSQTKQRQFARCCLDWTERRYHIAGTLGSMMLNRFRELKWLARLEGTRALRVTVEGQQGLSQLLRVKTNRSKT